MEALDFLKEAQRMCKSYTDCECCPLTNSACRLVRCVESCSDTYMRCITNVVEQWSKKHPVITNAQKFKEVFGEKTIDQLALCETRTVRQNVPKLFTKPSSWWDEPYKEPEHGGKI